MQRLADPDYDPFNFDYEPTDDFLANTLKDGMADGTIAISDDEFVADEYEEEEDDDKGKYKYYTSYLLRRSPFCFKEISLDQ